MTNFLIMIYLPLDITLEIETSDGTRIFEFTKLYF